MNRGTLSREGVLWISHVERATAWFGRLRGLLGRDALGPDVAMLIEHCSAIHTLGMRFAIDLVFLDRAWRVTRVVRNVRSGRLSVWGGWRAVRVLETEAGCVDISDLRRGDALEWRER